MRHLVNQELERLKNMINEQEVKTGKLYMFLDEYEYEDDYSGNEISEMQEELLNQFKTYLQENHAGKYAVQVGGYAVLVVTKEHYDGLGWKIGWEVC